MAAKRPSDGAAGKPAAPSRAAPRSIPGWEKQPGTAKQYRGPDGTLYSERYYRQNILYGGVKLESHASARAKPNKTYTRLLHARQDFLTRTTGKRPSIRAIQRSEEMKTIVRELRTAKRKEVNRDPDSPLAHALVDVGYRDPNAKYLVGDSDPNQRAYRERKPRANKKGRSTPAKKKTLAKKKTSAKKNASVKKKAPAQKTSAKKSRR